MVSKDSVQDLIHRDCYVRVETRLDIDKLLDLAEVNGHDVEPLRELASQPYGGSRVRMIVGNMLRGAVRRGEPVRNLAGEVVINGV